MKTYIIAAGLFLCTHILSQPFSVGKTSFLLRDANRSNRKIPVVVYYPSVMSDTQGPVASGIGKKFPLICFAHGYLLRTESYTQLIEALVPEGFILAIPETESGLFPSHKTLAEDLIFVFHQISEMGGNPTSLFFNRMDSARCFMGFSMGGGSSFTAASRHTDIHALVTLSPHNTRPSAILAASLVTVPTLIIGGTKDCITPPEKHQVPMYQSSASIDKTLILIMGAGHCQMVDQNSTCNFGERMKGCKPGISHEDQQKIIYRYLLPWLKFNLLGDIDAGSHFNMDIESDPAIEYMRSRPLSVTCPGNQ